MLRDIGSACVRDIGSAQGIAVAWQVEQARTIHISWGRLQRVIVQTAALWAGCERLPCYHRCNMTPILAIRQSHHHRHR